MKNTDYFVGSQSRPTYLVEIVKKTKQVRIYKPDKYSKNEEFYEKYSLGSLVLAAKYDDVQLSEPAVSYKTRYQFVPKIVFKIKKQFVVVSSTIKVKDAV